MQVDFRKQVCPFCNHIIEEGTFISRGGNLFIPKGGKIPLWYSKSASKEKNTIMLAPPCGLFHSVRPTVYVCRNCRMAFFPFQGPS